MISSTPASQLKRVDMDKVSDLDGLCLSQKLLW